MYGERASYYIDCVYEDEFPKNLARVIETFESYDNGKTWIKTK